MQEFREALSILKRDDECRVVLFTSTGTSFCEGLDLSELLHTNKEERRSVAQELAHAVKYVFLILRITIADFIVIYQNFCFLFQGTSLKVWLLLINL